MQQFFLLGLLGSLASAQTDGGACTYAVELMFLQDTSTSFDPWVELMKDEIQAMMKTFKETYQEFRMGVASFVDKPIPTLGVGSYGNKTWYADDYCYNLNHGLTENADEVEKALDDMYWDMGSGGDWPEAPLEGLAYAAGDLRVGWSTESHSAGGRPIVRVAMVVTDDVSHQPGDAEVAIHQSWEYPREWVNETYSVGGFGATTYFKSGNFLNDNWEGYAAMSELFHKYDEHTITDEEAAQLKKYVDAFGPYPWPELLANPNDGADRSLCAVTEYISAEAVGSLLKEKSIVPIFVSVANSYHGPEMDAICKAYGVKADAECLQKYYQGTLDEMGVAGVSVVMGFDDLRETIIKAVSSVTDMLCETTTTTTTTTKPSVVDSTTGVVVVPPETHTAVIPAETVTAVIPVETVTAVIPGETVTAVIPAETVTAVIPGETVTAVIPAETVTAVIPGETVTAVVPPRTVTAVIPAESVTAVVPPAVVPPVPLPVVPPQTFPVVEPSESVPVVVSPQTTDAVAPPPETATGADVTGVADTTEAEVVPPVGGASTGTIAGATAGSVAGLAAIGGVLYKKFGAALFHTSPNVPMDSVQQVEVPESPVERETMEEVTMDMFQ